MGSRAVLTASPVACITVTVHPSCIVPRPVVAVLKKENERACLWSIKLRVTLIYNSEDEDWQVEAEEISISPSSRRGILGDDALCQLISNPTPPAVFLHRSKEIYSLYNTGR